MAIDNKIIVHVAPARRELAMIIMSHFHYPRVTLSRGRFILIMTLKYSAESFIDKLTHASH